jgi:hypothetical protein
VFSELAAIALMARALFSWIFTPRPVSLKLLLANRLRGAATDDNLERILSEKKLGVNRWEKISKVIGLSQVNIIIAFNTFP